MTQFNPLLFLDFEGVLVLQSTIKYKQIAEALKDVGSRKGTLEDFETLWQGLFERRARENLKILNGEFQLTYCLTSKWAQLIDKAIMVKLLRQGGLEFVASRLHSRWDVAIPDQSTPRSKAITNCLMLNGGGTEDWYVLDDEASGTGFGDWPTTMQDRTTLCLSDVGFTDFESNKLRHALHQRSHLTKNILSYAEIETAKTVSNIKKRGSLGRENCFRRTNRRGSCSAGLCYCV